MLQWKYPISIAPQVVEYTDYVTLHRATINQSDT